MKKHALVTGGTRGIGRGIVNALCANDYEVLYTGTGENTDPWFCRCDLANGEDRESTVKAAVEKFGRLDLLVNNAGVAPLVRNDILQMTEESFDRVMGINLRGAFFLTQKVANWMVAEKQKTDDPDYKPRIVNIGSMSAYTSSTSRGEYCMSKAGVGMMTQLYADRLAEYRIPVFEIRPGIIDTDMTSVVHEKYQKMIDNGLLPIAQFGKPEDVANMVLACASGLLDYTTGQVLNADGGFHLRRL